jgi:cerevisin
MRSFFTVIALALYAVPGFGAATPALQDIQKYRGAVKANSYIVKLKDDASKSSVDSWVSSILGSDSSVTHDYDTSFFHGFAGM